MAKKPTREEIEVRAYEIYVEEGQPDGRELEHWLAAEKELADRQPEAEKETIPAIISQRSATAGRGRP